MPAQGLLIVWFWLQLADGRSPDERVQLRCARRRMGGEGEKPSAAALAAEQRDSHGGGEEVRDKRSPQRVGGREEQPRLCANVGVDHAHDRLLHELRAVLHPAAPRVVDAAAVPRVREPDAVRVRDRGEVGEASDDEACRCTSSLHAPRTAATYSGSSGRCVLNLAASRRFSGESRMCTERNAPGRSAAERITQRPSSRTHGRKRKRKRTASPSAAESLPYIHFLSRRRATCTTGVEPGTT